MAGEQFRYRAFISYSHADEKWARWLHRGLETYRIPKRLVGQKTEFGPVPAKLAPVFRDREELASATDLGSKLTDALEGTATLIVICSPSSANSHWVNEEILAYKRLGRANRVFSLIVGGEPYSSTIPGEEAQECFPPALRFQLNDQGELGSEPAEPIAADARPGKDGKAHAKIKLIAGMLGVGFDDLRQRELQRRNRRLAAISVSAVVGMVFAISLATAAFIARNEAQQQRERAETEAETARQTASFMIDLFNVSDPSEARGRSITAREILQKGSERIGTELNDHPRIQTSLMDTIGKVYTGLGLYEDASQMLEQAVDLREKLADVAPEEQARSLYNLANVLTKLAAYDRAGALYLDAGQLLQRENLGDSLLMIDIDAAIAELYFRTGDYELAEPLLNRVLERRLAEHGRRDPSVADAIEEVGLNHYDQGRLPDAESRLREALALRWETLGKEPHPDLAENMNNLALILKDQGKLEEAGELYLQSLAMNQRLYGESHPAIALSLGNLAQLHRDLGELDLAESHYKDALSIQRDLLGERHPEVARLVQNLAFVYQDAGDLDHAMELSREALAMQIELLGGEHPNTAEIMSVLGRWELETGNLETAESILREALAIQEAKLESGHVSTALTRVTLADALLQTGQAAEALEQAKSAESALEASLSGDHWLTALAWLEHGSALHANGDLAGAEELIKRSYSKLDSDPLAKQQYADAALQRLIVLYRDWGKTAEERKYLAVQAQRGKAG